MKLFLNFLVTSIKSANTQCKISLLILMIVQLTFRVYCQDKILSNLHFVNLEFPEKQITALNKDFQFSPSFLPNLAIQDSIDFFNKGFIDGNTYYNDNDPFWGGFVTGFNISWILPIIGTIIISNTPPENLFNPNNPNNDLLYTNTKYYEGFQAGATRKKSSKTWTGFAVGAGTVVVIFVIVLFISNPTIM